MRMYDTKIYNTPLQLIIGDITQFKVDAMVNSANSELKGGGGVDGAIHRCAGSELLEECKKWIQVYGSLKTGKAIITKGYNLSAKHVIHTVGPIYSQHTAQENDILLQSCYQNCLELASDYHLKTIAFCSISTGVYGFPIERASQVALETIVRFLEENDSFEQVFFVLYSQPVFESFLKTIKTIV